jgi:hypothetical protein
VDTFVSWLVLLAVMAGLGSIAANFTRRTYRIVALVAVVICVAVVTLSGLGIDHGGNLASAFVARADLIAGAWFGHPHVQIGRVAAIALLVVLAGVLVWFDAWSVRREQPRVNVPKAAKPKRADDTHGYQRELTEKLQFTLPAVDVRRPAVLPGSRTMDSIASVAVQSGVNDSGLAGALLQAVQAVQAQPRTYEVRVFAEPCEGGQQHGGDKQRRIAIEVQEVQTGQSFPAEVVCGAGDAAEKVAGVVARQVFRQDHATPAWAVGSLDGRDLSSYLIAQKMRPRDGTFEAWKECRRKRCRELEQAVASTTCSGLVGYELACLYDLEGRYLDSLLLQLRNRVYYPRFWRGRYRLAASMNMLAADPDGGAGRPARGRNAPHVLEDITNEMYLAHLIHDRHRSPIAALQSDDTREIRNAQRVLARLAGQEFDACLKQRRIRRLLWSAFWHRDDRSASLAALHDKPHWRYPRRRLWPIRFNQDIAEYRRRLLNYRIEVEKGKERPDPDPEERDIKHSLTKAQAKAWDCIGLDKKPAKKPIEPWSAIYNAACLHALPQPAGGLVDNAGGKAVDLLRLAVDHPDCALDRPSEWIGSDPDLRFLHKRDDFKLFVRELRGKDFDSRSSPDQDRLSTR